jgi:3,4-dihydroxy 2-butanone 4-phosphate synthase/GTP cyclohydrolase II
MCLTGDTFGSERCDCQNQLHQSIESIAKNGSGILLYLDQEGRGIGLENKIKAYALQDQGLDTVEANCKLGLPIDGRDYNIAADILNELGISNINLLTNNPAKISQLKKRGITVNPVPVEAEPNQHNKKYLADKKNKLGHKLTKV